MNYLNSNTMKNRKLPTKNFLPTGYQVPDKAKQFMKLTPGDNAIRALSKPLLGFIVFTQDNKPVRRRYEDGDFTQAELKELKAKKGEDGTFEGSRHFWILLVWDKGADAPKILEITQISIIKPLYELTQDADWGDLREFDVNIHRVGTGRTDTEFSVIPKPHKPLTNAIVGELERIEQSQGLNLDAIWEGNYPFEKYMY